MNNRLQNVEGKHQEALIEAKSQISLLTQKLQNTSEQLESQKSQFLDLQEKYSQKSREKNKLQELYNGLRRKSDATSEEMTQKFESKPFERTNPIIEQKPFEKKVESKPFEIKKKGFDFSKERSIDRPSERTSGNLFSSLKNNTLSSKNSIREDTKTNQRSFMSKNKMKSPNTPVNDSPVFSKESFGIKRHKTPKLFL